MTFCERFCSYIFYCNYRYVSCVLGCPYEGYIAPDAVAKVSVWVYFLFVLFEVGSPHLKL